jgi:hypothetical protein
VRFATLEALGLFAHAVHLGLVIFGLLGVGLLLLPGWRESRAARHGNAAWQAPATLSEHERRVAALRHSVNSGGVAAGGPGGAPPDAAVATLVEESLPPRRDPSLWRAFAVLSSMAAGIVHLAVFPHHIVEAGLVVGLFFVVAAAWQGWWAWQLTHQVTASQLRAGIAGSIALIALWAWSRTLGLPFGFTDGPEKVGAWDLACEFWQVCVVLSCLRGLNLHRGLRRGPNNDLLDPDDLDRLDLDQLGMGRLGAIAWTWAGMCAVALIVLSVAVSIH